MTVTHTGHHVLVLPSDTRHLVKVRQYVGGVLSSTGAFTAVAANMIALAVDEAVANIIEHGYRRRPGDEAPDNEDIIVMVDISAERLEVTIRDSSAGFDPRDVADVNVREHIRTGRRGGLGLFMIRRIMDDVQYSAPGDGHNELRLIKDLTTQRWPTAALAQGG